MRRLPGYHGWVAVLLLAVALAVMMGRVAWAAVSASKTVPAAFSVNLQANPEGALGFYSDGAATVPVTTLNFGELKPGVTGTVRVYIKNLTSGTVFGLFNTTDDLAKGSTQIYPYDLRNLISPNLVPGQARPFDIFLNLDPDIAVGAYQFTVTVNATTP
ncbi:MAG: hypothetical protein HY673_12865 [Chloroflexi bacterium]|nr:hypothetical protein [Chloroflexota bacterium]